MREGRGGASEGRRLDSEQGSRGATIPQSKEGWGWRGGEAGAALLLQLKSSALSVV